VLALYATSVLNLSPGVLGLVLGSAAAGALVGAAITNRVSRAVGVGRTFLLGCAVYPAFLLALPAVSGDHNLVVPILLVAEFCSGIGMMMLDVSAGSMLAVEIPDEVRSRVTGAFRAVNFGTRPVGTLLGGALGDSIGLRPTLWIAIGGAIASVLWLLPSPILSIRTLRDR